MAADSGGKQRGSDLDIFDSLGKKPSIAPPPPPQQVQAPLETPTVVVESPDSAALEAAMARAAPSPPAAARVSVAPPLPAPVRASAPPAPPPVEASPSPVAPPAAPPPERRASSPSFPERHQVPLEDEVTHIVEERLAAPEGVTGEVSISDVSISDEAAASHAAAYAPSPSRTTGQPASSLAAVARSAIASVETGRQPPHEEPEEGPTNPEQKLPAYNMDEPPPYLAARRAQAAEPLAPPERRSNGSRDHGRSNGTSQAAQSRPLPRVSAPPKVTARMAEEEVAAAPAPPPARSTMSRFGPMIGVAAVAALAAGIGLTMMPHAGRLAVNVADGKGAPITRVEIFVDGKKECDTVPCVVDPVKSGSHQVKVLAQGFQAPPDRVIDVASGKDTSLDLMLTADHANTGIKVSGNQPGVQLYVDGKDIGGLPQQVSDLTPGDHKIRIAGSDRYAPIEKSVVVTQDQVQDLGDQSLKVVKGKATINLSTPGAKVAVVSGSERHPLTSFPASIDLDTSKPWSIDATASGFNDYHQTIGFDDGVAEKTFSVTLDPKGAAAPEPEAAAAPAPAVQHSHSSAPAPSPAPAHEHTAAVAKDTSSSASASGGSFLNINSLPTSSVLLDGTPIGATPKLHVAVSPGSHSLVFINSEQGLKKQTTITVAAGETKPVIAKLRD